MRSTKTSPAFFLAEKLSLMSCVSRVTWSTVELPCQKLTCSQGSNGLISWLGRHERRWVSRGFYRWHTAGIWDDNSLGPPNGFSHLGIATSSVLIQIFGILSSKDLEKSPWNTFAAHPKAKSNERSLLIYLVNAYQQLAQSSIFCGGSTELFKKSWLTPDCTHKRRLLPACFQV